MGCCFSSATIWSSVTLISFPYQMFHLNLQSKFLFFIPFLYSSYETGWFKDREIFSYFKKKKKKNPTWGSREVIYNVCVLIFRFFAHILMMYLFTFWACYMLYKEYDVVASMRLNFLASKSRRAEQFTVLFFFFITLVNFYIRHFNFMSYFCRFLLKTCLMCMKILCPILWTISLKRITQLIIFVTR